MLSTTDFKMLLFLVCLDIHFFFSNVQNITKQKCIANTFYVIKVRLKMPFNKHKKITAFNQ